VSTFREIKVNIYELQDVSVSLFLLKYDN